MENPLHRTRSLTWQKWDSTVQKWDSALGKANRSGAIFNRHHSANDRMRSYNSGELRPDSRSRAFLSGELPLVRPPTEKGRSKVSHSGELRVVHPPFDNGKPRAFLSGELPLARPPASVPSGKHSESTRHTGRGSYSSGDSSRPVGNAASAEEESVKRASLKGGNRRGKKSQSQASSNAELIAGEQGQETDTELRCFSAVLDSYSDADAASSTSIQTEAEGSRSRLLTRRGESSSFRGKQLSSSLSDSPSFRKETVSSSFRSESGSRRKERKSSKSSQDGIGSRLACDSAAPSLHHNNQSGIARKSTTSCESNRASTPSSPDTCAGKSSVPFQWEETPGKTKTIAAAAEMALARKLVRDESVRRMNAASPRASVDGHSGRLSEKMASIHSSRCLSSDLPLPPSKKGAQEFSVLRKDSHSSHLVEKLKAAVVKKQEDQVSKVKGADKEDDTKSEMSDFGEQAHIDLVAPAAAKIFNREDDVPVLTPVKTPLAVPFKWEEAPGKPKDCGAPPPPPPEPPFLTLPPRLLGGCHNPSKEQQAKILESYSGNLTDMQWNASGNPTPLSRSRDATPTRRERTPTRRDRTPSKKDVNSGRRDTTPGRRDITPGRRDINPASRDSTPTRRSYFPARIVSNSGPLSFPSVHSSENASDHHSGPLRSNTLSESGLLPSSRSACFPPLDSRLLENFGDEQCAPLRRSSIPKSGPLPSSGLDLSASEEVSNRRREPVRSNTFPKNFNAVPGRASPDFSYAYSEASFANTTGEFDSSRRALSISGPGVQDNKQSSSMAPQELQIARCDSASDFPAMSSAGSDSGEVDKQPSLAMVTVDPLSPTSILCDPTISSQRTPSNLSSAYAESSHFHHSLKSVSRHSQSDSCTSLESFVDEAYNAPLPWMDGAALESSLSLELGPIENPGEAGQGNKLLDESVKAILNFCRKAKNWNKPRTTERKNSAEPDMWAPTLATYFQKLELGGTFLSKVGSQVFPESKDLKVSHTPVHFSLPCSPLRFSPRAGELTPTPDRVGPRKALADADKAQLDNVTSRRSPHGAIATEECMSASSFGRVWSGTKARPFKWGRKIRSSRLLCVIFGALKRSLKCGRHGLPGIPSKRSLLDPDVDPASKEHSSQAHLDAVHSLKADHQLLRPL